MGSSLPGSHRNEQPPHEVWVDGFWIDKHDVTNAEFRKFVEATGYKTTAERPIDWEELKKKVPPGTPKPPEEMLQPGSLVFTPSSGPVDLRNMNAWWRWVKGANWQHPEGPGAILRAARTIRWSRSPGMMRTPMQSGQESAFPLRQSGSLPRRVASTATLRLGDELQSEGKYMANTWTGQFPYRNTAEDGFVGTAPVKSFPSNGYGLYDMGGNVWNWVSDYYRPDTHVQMAASPPATIRRAPREVGIPDIRTRPTNM